MDKYSEIVVHTAVIAILVLFPRLAVCAVFALVVCVRAVLCVVFVVLYDLSLVVTLDHFVDNPGTRAFDSFVFIRVLCRPLIFG